MKKIVILIFSCLLIISGYFVYNHNNTLNTTNDSSISFMIYNISTQEYEKVSNIPKGNFVINTSKSYCLNDGEILGYDNTTKKVTYRLKGADSCFVYLDYENLTMAGIINNDAKTKDEITLEDTYGLIKEDDNRILYEGANADNYVCFKSSCEENELYRIIGLYKEENTEYLKLVKAIGLENTYGIDNDSNEFATSDLNTYLNNEYLNSLSFKSLIKNYNYKFISIDNTNISGSELYNLENASTNINSMKIGLLSPVDYSYSSFTDNCHETYLSNYVLCYRNGWLYLNNLEYYNNNEWILGTSSNNYALAININGNINLQDISSSYVVRPVFYIDGNITSQGGNGTITNPYILD